MHKHPGDFPIAVHPGEILREMLEDRELSQIDPGVARSVRRLRVPA